MSGPNGDPNVSTEDGIINDDDDFGDEGNERGLQLIVIRQFFPLYLHP